MLSNEVVPSGAAPTAVPEIRALRAVVVDWAGTILDVGCRAPVAVFREAFAARGVPITEAEARGPMGLGKRDHIVSIAALPRVRGEWARVHGAPPGDADVDAMYRDFLPLQLAVLARHAEPVPGAASALAALASAGLRVGSTSGYPAEVMEQLRPLAHSAGLAPEVVVCVSDVPAGRPAPWMLHEVARMLDVYPLWRMVAVGDTVADMAAARNAGCWAVGVTLSGNLVGRSADELERADAGDLARWHGEAADVLRAAGAHRVLRSVAELPELIVELERAAAAGGRP